jgi:aquaporin Z
VCIEVVGTFALVLGAGVAAFCAIPLVSVGLGLLVMMPISAIGHWAGGHLNPGVTMAALARRTLNPRTAAIHWLAQIAGGLLAACAVRAVLGADRIFARSSVPIIDSAVTAGLLAELVFAFLLSYVALGLTVIDASASTVRYDCMVGLAVLTGAIGILTLSAVAIKDVTIFHTTVASYFSWSTLWIYLVSHVIAGFVAGIAFLCFGCWAHIDGS